MAGAYTPSWATVSDMPDFPSSADTADFLVDGIKAAGLGLYGLGATAVSGLYGLGATAVSGIGSGDRKSTL